MRRMFDLEIDSELNAYLNIGKDDVCRPPEMDTI